MIVAITDGELFPGDLEGAKVPDVPCYWLIAGGANFTQPFGKMYRLDEQ